MNPGGFYIQESIFKITGLKLVKISFYYSVYKDIRKSGFGKHTDLDIVVMPLC